MFVKKFYNVTITPNERNSSKYAAEQAEAMNLLDGRNRNRNVGFEYETPADANRATGALYEYFRKRGIQMRINQRGKLVVVSPRA